MNVQYPENVINKILQVTLETQTFAYLAVDDQGVLINQGGKIQAMSLPSWSIGDNILNEALFLSGLLPMSDVYEYLPSFHATDSTVIDVHLFQDHEVNWVILVDKTADLEWQSQARQKGNELRLLQQKMDLQKDSQAKDCIEFFEALNMMAFRMNDDQSFEMLKPLAKQFASVYPEAFESSGSMYPQQKFAFVENFLIDAQQLWDSGENHNRLYSGAWVEQTAEGEEIALEAIALNWDDHKLLFIEMQGEGYQQNREFLQIGRESVLLKNILEEEVRKRTQDIRDREEEIALRLVCAADSRDDGETGAHIRRLGLYSELMAKHLGWTAIEIDEIRVAATMHDIGKIGIPDSILKKPGKLTEEEFKIMKLHPHIGARILSNSKSALVQMAREIALGHHEKWDGSGYPHGLSGENISISARIIAIVDVFDALIHKRVYKKEMPMDAALELMTEGRGKHFDPELFDLFIGLSDEMADIARDFIDPICGEDKKDRSQHLIDRFCMQDK